MAQRHPEFVDDNGNKMKPLDALKLGLNPETGYPFNFDDVEGEIRRTFPAPLGTEPKYDYTRFLIQTIRDFCAERKAQPAEAEKPQS